MGREIERKFLTLNDSWKKDAEGRYICQGYLSIRTSCTVRVRIDGDAAFLTLKGSNNGPERLEFDFAVPMVDAKAMLENFAVTPLVEKTRYLVHFGGLVWEVDEFHGPNRGLVIAEIELDAPDQHFVRPPWAGREVTDDPRYYNSRLAEQPYLLWGEDGGQ